MTRKFEFESLSRALPDGRAARLEVSIDVWCTDCDGDFGWEPEQIWDLDRDCEVPDGALTADEMSRIEERAESVAYDASPDAYQAYCEGRADAEYDRWKDEEMFRENEE